MLEGRHPWTSTVRPLCVRWRTSEELKVQQMCKLSTETMEPDMDTDQSL